MKGNSSAGSAILREKKIPTHPHYKIRCFNKNKRVNLTLTRISSRFGGRQRGLKITIAEAGDLALANTSNCSCDLRSGAHWLLYAYFEVFTVKKLTYGQLFKALPSEQFIGQLIR